MVPQLRGEEWWVGGETEREGEREGERGGKERDGVRTVPVFEYPVVSSSAGCGISNHENTLSELCAGTCRL